jgi:hypothetical protein
MLSLGWQGVSQVIEGLPRKLKALSSNSSTATHTKNADFYFLFCIHQGTNFSTCCICFIDESFLLSL